MKKERLILIVLVLYFFFILFIFGDKIFYYKDNLLSGKVTSAPLNISIVIAAPPNITILRPLNFTYNINNSIELRYSVIGGAPDTISLTWYNIDDGVNTTLNGYVNLSTNEGSHKLRLYANNTVDASNFSQVYFFVNNSFRFNISYAQYSGNTTDFNSFTHEQFENITNFTLEKPSFGQIFFLENINISYDDVNLDSFTEIRSNYIALNSSSTPFLNKSAKLSLYGLTFSNPRLLKEGSICPDTICKKISYNNGILIFNVTGFTYYSAEETPSGGVGSGSGGSSGSTSYTGSIVYAKNQTTIVINPDLIKISLKQNENLKVYFELTNNGKEELDVDIDSTNVKDFVTFITGENKLHLKLKPGEKKIVQLIFSASTSTDPGVYNRIIKITSGDIKQIINLVIEIESKEALFDVITKIPDRYKYIAPGNILLAEVTIFNVKPLGNIVDVTIDFQIKTLAGEVIISGQETRAIDRQISFVKELNIPKDAVSGQYILYVKASYKSNVGSSTESFHVEKELRFPEQYLNNLVISSPVLSLMILSIIILALLYRKFKKDKEIK